jgi:hypothetical protein
LHRLAFFVSVVTVAVVACTQTDLNTPCVLVRGNPDGGRPIAILKTDDVIKNSAQEDFISFGSAECDDQVCVRDSAFTEDAGDSSPEAHGYCSTYCTEGSNSSCQSATGALDSNPTTKLSCRALLLDSATLAAIKMADPERYAEEFGMTTSPFFCARSSTFGDAGM